MEFFQSGKVGTMTVLVCTKLILIISYSQIRHELKVNSTYLEKI